MDGEARHFGADPTKTSPDDRLSNLSHNLTVRRLDKIA
jgi:hypothetical protein